MGRRKISSDDFISLLDDQEVTAERPAFKPHQRKRKSEPERHAKFSLTPIQREWVNLALSKTPEFIKRAATSDRTVHTLERMYASLDEAIAALHRARAARNSKG